MTGIFRAGAAVGLLAAGLLMAPPVPSAGAEPVGGEPTIPEQLNRRIDRQLNQENRRYQNFRYRLDRLQQQRNRQQGLINRHLQDLRQRQEDRKRYPYYRR